LLLEGEWSTLDVRAMHAEELGRGRPVAPLPRTA